jgi:citrate lyase subunit beta/citryl-CoA lyase
VPYTLDGDRDPLVRLATATTLLFTPADTPHRLTRALGSSADIVVADLEDAIAPSAKARARDELRRFDWPSPGRGPLRCVRINGMRDAEHERDVALVSELDVDLVMLPKASEAALASRDWPAPVFPIIETAAAVLGAAAMCRHPAVAAVLFGSIDLGTELSVEPSAAEPAMLPARAGVVLACAAAGLRAPFDGVHLALHDEDGLRREARRARALGFGGKACIHPDQLATVAACFAPSAAQLDWARRVLTAAAAARDEDRGVTVVDGEMVDAPVVARARSLLRSAPHADRPPSAPFTLGPPE